MKTIWIFYCFFLAFSHALEAGAADQAVNRPAVEPGPVNANPDLDPEYKKLLALVKKQRKPTKPFSGELEIDDKPAIGSRSAPVVLIEFGDYQCPYCRRHLQQAAQRLRSDWVLSGDLLYVFDDFPIGTRHPLANKAAVAARCATEQGRYWEMRNVLYGAQKALHESFLAAHAQSAGLEAGQFNQCLESGRYQIDIDNSIKLGSSLGIKGTPTFFLGLNQGGGRVRLTRRITGAVDYAIFDREIRALQRMARSTADEVNEPATDRRMSRLEKRAP